MQRSSSAAHFASAPLPAFTAISPSRRLTFATPAPILCALFRLLHRKPDFPPIRAHFLVFAIATFVRFSIDYAGWTGAPRGQRPARTNDRVGRSPWVTAQASLPDNPFNPANRYDPGNPVNPANRYSPNNPFNPANQINPENPLNPANRYNPTTPFAPLNRSR